MMAFISFVNDTVAIYGQSALVVSTVIVVKVVESSWIKEIDAHE